MTYRVVAICLALCLLSAPVVAREQAVPAFDKRTLSSVKLIRGVFDKQAKRTKKAMQKHVAGIDVRVIEDQPYLEGDSDAKVDIYLPAGAAAGQRYPAVIWIHGGAWLSGSRKDAAPYFKLLANQGYVVLAPGYSLAPSAQYPKPVLQLTALKRWLDAEAENLQIDGKRLFLAGDSAGAQLAAQLALLGSNAAYAKEVGIAGVYTPASVRGVLLNCGVFDLPALVRSEPGRSRLMSWGTGKTALVYAGSNDPNSPVLLQMSPVAHVTASFPATWISGGNADPLTAGHSKPLAARLQALGVPVTTLFWPDDYAPKLEHEYQFNLDRDAGQQALRSMLQFLKQRR